MTKKRPNGRIRPGEFCDVWFVDKYAAILCDKCLDGHIYAPTVKSGTIDSWIESRGSRPAADVIYGDYDHAMLEPSRMYRTREEAEAELAAMNAVDHG